jgi:GMP synthase-like glutamine amidotransferase
MNILIIQNGFCKSSIYNFLEGNITTIRSYDKINYNNVEYIQQFNKIIILGGTQSLVEIDKYPYLYKIVELIKIAISNNISLIGICLGCQLLAFSYGCKIVKMDKSEIGYNSKIKLNGEYIDNILSFHTDTIIPNDKIIILSQYNTYPYIIKVGSAYGFQFHPEVNYNVLCIFLNYKRNILINDDECKKIKDYAIKNSKKIQESSNKIFKFIKN